MKITQVLGLVLPAVVLLLIAWLVGAGEIWGRFAGAAIPWLCTALALAVAILTIACAMFHCGPGELPGRGALAICLAVILLAGGALAVQAQGEKSAEAYKLDSKIDAAAGAPVQVWRQEDLRMSVAQWFGFAVILTVVFLVPRVAQRPPAGEPPAKK